MFGWRISAGYLDGQRAGVIKEKGLACGIYGIGGISLLLIQNINLCWSKNERGTDYAEVRRQLPPAYP